MFYLVKHVDSQLAERVYSSESLMEVQSMMVKEAMAQCANKPQFIDINDFDAELGDTCWWIEVELNGMVHRYDSLAFEVFIQHIQHFTQRIRLTF